MKTVFECAFGVEAHLVSNLLRDNGIENRVLGEYLQGAAGELPVGRLVRVVVGDEDAKAARAVIAEWDDAAAPVLPDSQESPEPASASDSDAALRWWAGGLLAALAFGYVVSLR